MAAFDDKDLGGLAGPQIQLEEPKLGWVEFLTTDTESSCILHSHSSSFSLSSYFILSYATSFWGI
jgi:hypothetical protein